MCTRHVYLSRPDVIFVFFDRTDTADGGDGGGRGGVRLRDHTRHGAVGRRWGFGEGCESEGTLF